MTGVSDAKYFGKVFKKETGLSPMEFVEQNIEGAKKNAPTMIFTPISVQFYPHVLRRRELLLCPEMLLHKYRKTQKNIYDENTIFLLYVPLLAYCRSGSMKRCRGT